MSTTIAIPLYPQVTILDFAGPYQVFYFTAGFKPVLVAETLDPLQTDEGVTVTPQATFADLPRPDVLFVPGGGAGAATAMSNRALLEYLRQAADSAGWVCSVCTGALILASAGLLDGFKATTYWNFIPALQVFKEVRVVNGYPRYVVDRNRVTGGGISSGIDEALEIASLIAGPDAARQSQLGIQYQPDPPFRDGDPSTAQPDVYIAQFDAQRGILAQFLKAAQQAAAGQGEGGGQNA